MKKLAFTLIILFSFLSCKKSDETFPSRGTVTVGGRTFEINNATRVIEPGGMLILPEQTIIGQNHFYTFYSTETKSKVVLVIRASKKELTSGQYFLNRNSVTVSGNNAQVTYHLEEDIGQPDRLVISKCDLKLSKNGEIEIIEFNTQGDDRVSMKWEGKL